MTFYNYIEDARYEMFKLVNGWTREGAETKGRISESLDNARIEYMQKESENAKLREQVTQLRDDWESERDYADQMEAKEEMAVAENAKLRTVCSNYMRRAYASAIEKGNQAMVEIIENEALILGIEMAE